MKSTCLKGKGLFLAWFPAFEEGAVLGVNLGRPTGTSGDLVEVE